MRDVQPRMRGDAYLARYADDAVLVFQCEDDARRVLAVLAKRFAKYGLTIHPEKTKLVPFCKPSRLSTQTSTRRRWESFDFLGFTHYWGRSHEGYWAVRQRTAKDRLARSLRSVAAWCKGHRHLPVVVQHAALRRKLLGHYGLLRPCRQLPLAQALSLGPAAYLAEMAEPSLPRQFNAAGAVRPLA